MPRFNHRKPADSNYKEVHAHNENELVSISKEKDLGVIIDNKLKFEDRIGERVNKIKLD